MYIESGRKRLSLGRKSPVPLRFPGGKTSRYRKECYKKCFKKKKQQYRDTMYQLKYKVCVILLFEIVLTADVNAYTRVTVMNIYILAN